MQNTHGANLLTAYEFSEPLGLSPLMLYNDDELVSSSMATVRGFRYICAPVTNYGTVFTTPNYHLGRSLRNGSDPYEIGSLGLSYYQKILEQLQAIVIDK